LGVSSKRRAKPTRDGWQALAASSDGHEGRAQPAQRRTLGL